MFPASWLASWLPAGCALWATLSVSTLLADPDGVPVQVAAEAAAHLHAAESIGRVAMWLDRGPSPLRWALSLRPASEAAPAILGDAAADVARAGAVVRLEQRALLAAWAGAPPPPPAGIQERVARWVVGALRARPEPPPPPEAALRATEPLQAIQQAVRRGRLRLVFLAVQVGLVRWTELLALGLAIRWTLRQPVVRPGPLPVTPLEPPTRSAWTLPRLGGPRRDPLSRALLATGVPRRLAGALIERLDRHPDWPGSLRGHDRAPGGLRRHTGRVVREMWGLTRTWPPAERRLALVLAAAHDLGKLLAYRRTGPGRWAGSPATPHDSLSVTLLLGLPGWQALAPPDARQALCLALFSYHAPDTLPSPAPPLARRLMDALIEADRRAVAAAGGGPEGSDVA